MLALKLIINKDLADLVKGSRSADGGVTRVRGLPEPTSLLDAIEAIGIPRCEIGMLTGADGSERAATDLTIDGDEIRVESAGARPLAAPRFLCDAHLGKLARLLRILGFDTVWRGDWTPAGILRRSLNEQRTVLSGSRDLLKRRDLGTALLVRAGRPDDQVAQVVARFGLAQQVQMFGRCSRCNGPLQTVGKADVLDRVPPRTARWCDSYHACEDCGQIYWAGTHVEVLRRRLAGLGLLPEPTPITRTEPIELDRPFWRCAALLPAGAPTFLLDSAMDPQHRGRWSHLGGEPAALLTGKRCGSPAAGMDLCLTVWREPDGRRHDRPLVRTWQADPFDALRQLQTEYRPPGGNAGSPRGTHALRSSGPSAGPFIGGLVGYFGYETAYAVETLPDTGDDDPALPDLAFLVADDVLSHDHRTGRTTVSLTGRGPDHAAACADAEARLVRWRNRLAAPAPDTHPETPGADHVGDPVDLSDVRCLFTREEYERVVAQCRQRILAGDVFEVCPTHRMEMALQGSAWRLYEVLRDINPAPFASYLDFGDFQVVSASPERFLRVAPGRAVESRPIKGTRPRGGDPTTDERLRKELAASAKDRAENVMIVDLMRNDLGRVCEIGSVAVPELCAVESFATVHQMVSTISGKLRADRDALDLVRACFPGGSMTGAPKVAAMEIIDAVEPVKRGVYSGAIGYLAHGGAVELSIVIRTAVCRDGRARFGVGGAVTADSDPGAEYEETLDKARALIAAVRRVNDGAL